MNTAIALVLALALAAPPPERTCATGDLRCASAVNAAAAADPQNPVRARALHAVTAVAAELGLFRETQDAAHLCVALERSERALALGAMRDALLRYQSEAQQELARRGVTCTRPAQPVAQARPAGKARPATRVAEAPEAAPEAAPAREPAASLAVEDVKAWEEPSAEPPARPAAEPPVRPAAEPPAAVAASSPAPAPIALPAPAPAVDIPVREDRSKTRTRWLFAGGALAAGTSAGLAALAAVSRVRRDEARDDHEEVARDAWLRGYTDPLTGAVAARIEYEMNRIHGGMIAAAIASGILGGAAIALFAVGGRRLGRSRALALRPGLAGAALVGRF